MTAETFEEFQQKYDAEMAGAIKALDSNWGVKGYKAHDTSNGVAYVFELTDDGTTVAWVEEAGRGGGPSVSWQDRRGIVAQAFAAEAKRLFTAGVPEEDMVEAILQRAGK